MNDVPTPRAVDPWVAISRITGGILIYGAIGYGLDLWWGTSFMVGLGIVVGAGLGLYTIAASLKEHDRSSSEG